MGLLILCALATFAYFSIHVQRDRLMDQMVEKASCFSETLSEVIEHSMLRHDAEGIDAMVQSMGRQQGAYVVRVLNSSGVVRFTNRAVELGKSVDREAEGCTKCHIRGDGILTSPPMQRTRIYFSPHGNRVLGMITPIYNQRACFTAQCHVHKDGDRVLGILDVGVSLDEMDRTISQAIRRTLLFAIFLFLGVTALLTLGLVRFVERPVCRLMEAIDRISRGEYGYEIESTSGDELGQLAQSFNRMSDLIRLREEELERNRREYETLFENVPTLIAVVDREYRIVQANRNFKETFGHRLGENCFSAYKGLDSRCQNCPVEKTFLDGNPHRSEETGLTRKGDEIQYLVYTAPIFDAHGEVQYAIEMSVDLRETKRLERELRVSQEYLNNLVENSIHGILATDSSGRIIIYNRSAERIMGYEAKEVLGSRDLERFFPSEFARRVRIGLAQGDKAEELKMVSQETGVRSKDGELIPVRFSGLILLEEGSAVGAVGFFQDLRPLKELERQKIQAERLAVVGQTVAALAHGIKNIITGLEGGVYVVQTALRRRDDALLQRGWGMVERNIEKVSNLIKDLLSYSRVSAAEIKRASPNKLAEEVFNLYSEKARQAGVEMALETDAEMDEAYLDPQATHTCLANLIANAIDACVDDEEGKAHRVVVRTRKGESGEVVFEVEDNGVGMTEEVRERLFRNFFTTKGTRGTGLGLMVTHKLVHEMGGRIEVETQSGEGSCFRIMIPQFQILKS
jgi:histidine kinase